MSVLTLALAKTHLNITVSTYDTELQTVIDAAEAAIAKVVGPLSSTSYTRRVRGGSCELVLPVSPVISLTSVTPVNGTALTLGDLYLESETGIVRWSLSDRAFSYAWYTVVFAAGRSSLPDDLLMAVKELVRHIWTTQRGGTTRPGSRPSADLSNTLPGAAHTFPIRVTQLLAPHRLIVS